MSMRPRWVIATDSRAHPSLARLATNKQKCSSIWCNGPSSPVMVPLVLKKPIKLLSSRYSRFNWPMH